MTLEGWVKKQIERRYSTCWTFDRPKDIHVVSTDFMQFVKGQVPDYISNLKQLIRYFIKKILEILEYTNIAVICFDKASPDVKKIVCHTTRYDKRCKQCKTTETFHNECTMGCINRQALKHEDGPHLSMDEDAPLSFKGDWMQFASDSRNLHYELYPRIVNAIISMKIPMGKMIFLCGLPFLPFFEPWTESTMANKTNFNFDNVYVFEGGAEPRMVPEMYNTIHEADNSIFYFSQFFPHHYRHVMFINDGDAISIGLFRALEDIRGPQSIVQEHWICLPYRNKKDKAMLAKPPPFQFLNLTKLCQKIEQTPEFISAGIQSPIATIIFLIIISGTDFFNKDDLFFGIGGEGIWNTFYNNLETYSHLVQYYPNVKDPKIERRIVFDEDLFKVFVNQCFIDKYAEACKKKFREDDVDLKMIKIHCSKLKDPRKHVPSDEKIIRCCRQMTWNENYWANAFRNIYIDPFTVHQGLPYFGYTKDMQITDVVSLKQKAVDEVHKRHFWKRKQKQTVEPVKKISEKKKLAVLDLLRGE